MYAFNTCSCLCVEGRTVQVHVSLSYSWQNMQWTHRTNCSFDFHFVCIETVNFKCISHCVPLKYTVTVSVMFCQFFWICQEYNGGQELLFYLGLVPCNFGMTDVKLVTVNKANQALKYCTQYKPCYKILAKNALVTQSWLRSCLEGQ